MNALRNLRHTIVDMLESTGDWFALLPVRLLLAWEFGRAGMTKLHGTNWFGNVRDDFPFPFNVIPIEISWFLATWIELLGAIGLILGLFTRFWALSLMVLTVVAIAGVHWPNDWDSLAELWRGYSVSDNGFGNFRIPLLFLAMLLPLLLKGPGRLSIDHALVRRTGLG